MASSSRYSLSTSEVISRVLSDCEESDFSDIFEDDEDDYSSNGEFSDDTDQAREGTHISGNASNNSNFESEDSIRDPDSQLKNNDREQGHGRRHSRQICGRGQGRGRGRGRGWGRGRGRARERGRGRGRGRGRRQVQSTTTEETWTIITDRQNDKTPNVHQFCEQPGIRSTLTSQSSPIDIFNLFLDGNVFTMLVEGTNSYAERTISSKGVLSPQSRWRNWTPVTNDEMNAVVAIIINMGILHCPEVEGYWKTSWESYVPIFHDVLPGNRFEQIFWMLHLPEQTIPQYRLDKVRPLLEYLVSRFQSVFYPACEISIDKTMIGFKGRVSFQLYCPMKPTKWGLKAFVLADSSTGYVLNIIPYTGRETRETFLSNISSELPVYTQVVLAVVDPYLNKGHHLFADRYYTSVPLVNELQKNGTGYTDRYCYKNKKRHTISSPCKRVQTSS